MYYNSFSHLWQLLLLRTSFKIIFHKFLITLLYHNTHHLNHKFDQLNIFVNYNYFKHYFDQKWDLKVYIYSCDDRI